MHRKRQHIRRRRRRPRESSNAGGDDDRNHAGDGDAKVLKTANQYILEYLRHHGFKSTQSAFHSELVHRGERVPLLAGSATCEQPMLQRLIATSTRHRPQPPSPSRSPPPPPKQQPQLLSVETTFVRTPPSRLSVHHDHHAPSRQSKRPPPSLQRLDYGKIRRDLLYLPDLQRANLLQALRWRLEVPLFGQRRRILKQYVTSDVFGLGHGHSGGTGGGGGGGGMAAASSIVRRYPGGMAVRTSIHSDADAHDGSDGVIFQALLMRKNVHVREACARMVFAMCGFVHGRSYICKRTETLAEIFTALSHEQESDDVKNCLLGALERCSVRSRVQRTLTEIGVIEWIVAQLRRDSVVITHINVDEHIVHRLQYLLALLQHLCSKLVGRKRCEDRKVCMPLFASLSLVYERNDDIMKRSACGALYYILRRSATRRRAQNHGALVAAIEGLANNHRYEKQSRYLLQRLYDDDLDDGVDDKSDSSASGGDGADEEAAELVDERSREHEVVASAAELRDELRKFVRKGMLRGEALLTTEYKKASLHHTEHTQSRKSFVTADSMGAPIVTGFMSPTPASVRPPSQGNHHTTASSSSPLQQQHGKKKQSPDRKLKRRQTVSDFLRTRKQQQQQQ